MTVEFVGFIEVTQAHNGRALAVNIANIEGVESYLDARHDEPLATLVVASKHLPDRIPTTNGYLEITDELHARSSSAAAELTEARLENAEWRQGLRT